MSVQIEPEGERHTIVRGDEIAAVVAHELRSPLIAMSNVLQLCRGDAEALSLPNATELLGRQLHKALCLLDDLEGASRFGRAVYTVAVAPLDLLEVVHDASNECTHRFKARQQLLTLDLPLEPVLVCGDALRLEQVIVNLLNNSSKFTPSGGHVTLGLACEQEQAVLCVRDDGMGILPQDLPHVFELFYQVQPQPDLPEPGMGIGLALARRFVQLHGGTITACSEGLDRGAEIIVRLPLARR